MSKLYAFHNTDYTRYDTKRDMTDTGNPRAISGNWPGLPASGIDAAL